MRVLLNLVVRPETPVTVWRDGADNWFMMGETSQRIRVVSEIAIDRDVFASEYPDISWNELPRVPQQPSTHRDSYDQVASAIGISKSQSPREVVSKLVSYFRSFGPSTDSPNEHGDIYLDLALSKKGVCRHRSFAFLVTALNIGIPTRLVHNEAHAWGGGSRQPDVASHRLGRRRARSRAGSTPRAPGRTCRRRDQFAWPTGRDSGSDLAHRDRSQAMQEAAAQAGGGASQQSAGPNDPNQFGEPDPSVPNPAKDMPATELTLDEIDRDIFRGLPVRVKGTAKSEGQPCPHIRVDVIMLLAGDDAERRLGSLSTDEDGNYGGAVVVPSDIPIGDHELVVATPGAGKCGPGQAQ